MGPCTESKDFFESNVNTKEAHEYNLSVDITHSMRNLRNLSSHQLVCLSCDVVIIAAND